LDSNNYVMFFGGAGATQHDVDAWGKSAKEQRPSYNFMTFPFPKGTLSTDPLSHWYRSAPLADAVKQTPDVSYHIVGHSSGAGIANDVAGKALARGATNFKLICLDGFAPIKLLEKYYTIWSAKNWAHKIYSLNYNVLHKFKHFHVYESNCSKIWPLHFSLINLHASDDYPHVSKGYHNVKANLIWLT
jgi:hypothetical protein